MKGRTRRACGVAAGLVTLGGAAALVLNAFNSNVMFFVTPSQLAMEGMAPRSQSARVRVGGLVEHGSIQRDASGLSVRFMITDTARDIPVEYRGVLPDLFREGKGVVAEGRLSSEGVFVADQVLARHDEKYMPPEAAEAVKRARPVVKISDKTGAVR